MKVKNIMKTLAALCCVSLLMPSCSDWLEVDMEDEILENQLYETNGGFVASLNGVYTKMNETYGSDLSMTTLDVMAQYYDVAQNSMHQFYDFANYKFSQEKVEKKSGDIWTNLYELIANLNLLLEHCDGAGTALQANYYPYVKGEALALRAMLHFDLLRLYGPIYSPATENELTIPYEETSSKDIQPLLPAKEVMVKVIKDLEAAADLLKEDKIRTEGVMNSDSENPNENADFRYRQYRLNYYAVQALLARAYMWIDDKERAYTIATDLIKENKEKNVFPWTPKAKVQATDKPDRIFSTEALFCLFNMSRVNLFDTYFKKSAKISNALTFKGETLTDDYGKLIYFYTEENDLRRGDNMWSAETLEETNEFGATSTQKTLCFSRYDDVADNSIRYMIPLIRMSEVYLIAAECAAARADLKEAIGYINDIRRNRNCVNLELKDSDTKEKILPYITDEFAREMIGEGQLYFYYKRHAMTSILSGTSFSYWGTTYNMDLQNYVWPLPKVETDKRVNN